MGPRAVKKSGGKEAAIALLSGVDSIEVREKASMIEGLAALMGYEYEMGNKYRVYKRWEGDLLRCGGDRLLPEAAEVVLW